MTDTDSNQTPKDLCKSVRKEVLVACALVEKKLHQSARFERNKQPKKDAENMADGKEMIQRFQG